MKRFYYFSILFLLLSCHPQAGSPEQAMKDVAEEYSETDFVMEADEADDSFGSFDDEESKSEGSPKKKPSKTWKRSNKIANTATLFVGDTEQIPLRASQIAVKVDGFRARVLIDCFFYNDRNSQLEGTFKMKLPQGAKPYYFAFGEDEFVKELGKLKRPDKPDWMEWIPFVSDDAQDFSPEKIEDVRSNTWISPKVARVVEKEKAAFAYGQTVRKRIDPALAEWAGADVYNCRVFPLSAKKLHRIVIGYDVNLTSLEDDFIFNFPVPELDCPLVLNFDVADIKGVKCSISPKIKTKSANGRQAFEIKNPIEKEINIRYSDCQNIALRSQKNEEEASYFAASVAPQLPSSRTQVSENAIIALDISLSSNPDKFNVWLKLTEALLANNRNAIKRFNVLLFNVESRWWQKRWVDNTPANTNDFLSYASQLSLEGATDLNLVLSAISDAKWVKKSSKNIFLLSDGADTWGESDAYEMEKNIKKNDRLFAYNTGMSGTSITKLSQLTRASGGALFSVTGEDEIHKASTAFTTKPWKITKISMAGVSDILIAGRPQYIYSGQKLMLAGRGSLSKTASLSLNLSQGDVTKTITVRIQKSLESELTARTYGQLATETLEEFDYATEKKSIAYAKHFKVPGKTCSLLMLETEDDHKAYNIKATEDAFVVKSTSVNDVLASVLKDIAQTLSSAKSKFKNWMGRLSSMDGFDFKVPTSMDILIDKIPEVRFSVKQNSLSCKAILKQDLSKEFSAELLKTRLDYDRINEEASRRQQEYSSDDALRALSSLVEKNPGDGVLARDVAYSALNWDLNAQAYHLFKRVLKSRPYEPQTYLAIAKSLSKIENYELAMLYYEIAITAEWDGRFGEFRRIAALDYLNLLGQIKDKNNFNLSDYAQARHKTLRAEFKEEYADLMLVISWNTDNTDIDLHVIEPTGEECFYSHRETKIGGYLTQDVTQGYGPEMYILKDAKKGKYEVKVKYFSSNRSRASTRTKVYATIYKNWGKKNESVSTKIVSLEDNKEMHGIVVLDID